MRILILALLIIFLNGSCEDKRLKRAEQEAALWKFEARKWEETSNDWEAVATKAIATAKACQDREREAEKKK